MHRDQKVFSNLVVSSIPLNISSANFLCTLPGTDAHASFLCLLYFLIVGGLDLFTLVYLSAVCCTGAILWLALFRLWGNFLHSL